MIKIDPVIKVIKSAKKPMEFEKIFKEVKSDYVGFEDNNALKADMVNAMIGSIELIMIGKNIWDLKKNYSLSEVARIETLNRGISIEEGE